MQNDRLREMKDILEIILEFKFRDIVVPVNNEGRRERTSAGFDNEGLNMKCDLINRA